MCLRYVCSCQVSSRNIFNVMAAWMITLLFPSTYDISQVPVSALNHGKLRSYLPIVSGKNIWISFHFSSQANKSSWNVFYRITKTACPNNIKANESHHTTISQKTSLETTFTSIIIAYVKCTSIYVVYA